MLQFLPTGLEVASRFVLRHRLHVQAGAVRDHRLEGDRSFDNGRIELLLKAFKEVRPTDFLGQQVADKIVRPGNTSQTRGYMFAQLIESNTGRRTTLIHHESIDGDVLKQAFGPG